MKHQFKQLFILALLAYSSSIAFADEKSKDAKSLVTPPLQWKAVSLSIPMEGQYLMISKNTYFYEGKVLSENEFTDSIEAKDVIDGKKLIAFHAMKGCPHEDFMEVFNRLHKNGFAVCSSAHPIDLNTLYRNIADSNQIHQNKESEQVGTGQPATRPESDFEGSDKPKPESEGRSR